MGNRVIALVNNEPTFRWTVSRLLEQVGILVESYPRDAGAVERVRSARPAAVLLEASYGSAAVATSLVERLKAGADTRYVPIVVCSPDARFLSSYGEYLRGIGCLVIGRPFDRARFVALVGDLARPATTPTDAVISESVRPYS